MAGPDRSSRSAAETVSLTVRIATRISSTLARLGRLDWIAIGFVHKTHRFHEQAGGVARGRGTGRLVGGVEIDFELAGGPENDFVDRIVAFDVADLCVAALAAGEIKLPLLAALTDDEAARFLAHFERLHEVDHAHFFEAALNDARTRSFLLKLLEVQTVDDFLCDGDEIFDAIDQGAEALFDVGAAGHEQEWDVARGFAAAEFFEKLPAVEARHL